MRLVFDPEGQRKEQRGIELWKWLMSRIQGCWPDADVRYHSYSGVNHRHWRILRSTGEYRVLAVTEDVLDTFSTETIVRCLEEGNWLEALEQTTATGLLLTTDGSLIEWCPRAGGVTV